MARFYGWNDEYLEQMDIRTFREYLECITILDSQESLVWLTISDFPHQKQEHRDEVHRNFYVNAYPSRKKMSIEEALTKLGRGR